MNLRSCTACAVWFTNEMGEAPMGQVGERYPERRDIWNDYNHRQEFEHDLINRKTTWWLTYDPLCRVRRDVK